MQEQVTSNLLMIRPVNFAFNQETASSNTFQQPEDINREALNTSAQECFDELVAQLRLRDINVHVFEDTPEPYTPDSIFPNNWLSTHHSGKVMIYPVEAANRRAERRQDVLDFLKKNYDFHVLLDLTHFETDGKYLEGTGSIVLDRINRIAYACLSSRTHPEVLKAWQKVIDYELVTFEAFDKAGVPVYHTNVVMSMGDTFCVICLEAIADPDQRLAVKQKLESSGKTIMEITMDQMSAFAGNMLLVKNRKDKNFLVMSDRAYASLTREQADTMDYFAEILHTDLGYIETVGGGSARCMIAEIHLPEK
ncbi:citrulline utilization hydrolase CtlX [Leadbetterella sp. DM7]|uniref:citrulline utilization hydrolase CtlX n=1 Tax=Leadbetterella sp. DM7 TaxID=3235085 RepID=UPI00349EC447